MHLSKKASHATLAKLHSYTRYREIQNVPLIGNTELSEVFYIKICFVIFDYELIEHLKVKWSEHSISIMNNLAIPTSNAKAPEN